LQYLPPALAVSWGGDDDDSPAATAIAPPDQGSELNPNDLADLRQPTSTHFLADNRAAAANSGSPPGRASGASPLGTTIHDFQTLCECTETRVALGPPRFGNCGLQYDLPHRFAFL
jgi:hypothetical protein